MKALITGGSSGIGLSIAKELHKRGYEIILVARDEKKLELAKQSIDKTTTIIPLDISKTENCIKLYEQLKNEPINILINSAGIGLHGEFTENDLDKLNHLVDLNIKTTQTLTRLFLPKFLNQKSGYILNIASTAAFSPGPLMASYFASKAYILNLTEAIAEEIKYKNKDIYIGCLCPGPVDTHFNDLLGVEFKKAQNSDDLAVYAMDNMFKKRKVIIPTLNHKLNCFFNRFIPHKILLKANYNVQIKKIKNKKKNK